MAHKDYRRNGYRISTDRSQVDVDAVHAYLARSYWARGIPRDIVVKAIRESLCFGLFNGRRQVGFARVVTDRATFGYLCDVYVLEEASGVGARQVVDANGRVSPGPEGSEALRAHHEGCARAVCASSVQASGEAGNLHGNQSSGFL